VFDKAFAIPDYLERFALVMRQHKAVAKLQRQRISTLVPIARRRTAISESLAGLLAQHLVP